MTARAELTASVTDGHDGTEPALWSVYFRRILELTGLEPERRDAVGTAMRDGHRAKHLWTYTPAAIRSALGRLGDAGLRLGVVSNADGRMESAIESAGIRDYFEFVIDSGKVGVSKPHPEIFRQAAKSLALPADRCLYVGDLYPVDVVGAWRAGMHAVLVDPTDSAQTLSVTTIGSVAELPELLQTVRTTGLSHPDGEVRRA